MSRVLVVHHTPSPACQALLESALAGLAEVEGVEVVTRAALTCSPVDLLEADGVVLGTPANLGYMSGALKHFFDGAYYPTLLEKTGLPYAIWVHGQSDTTGAVRSVTTAATGLRWREVAAAVTVTGEPNREQLAAVADAAATVGAHAAGLL